MLTNWQLWDTFISKIVYGFFLSNIIRMYDEFDLLRFLIISHIEYASCIRVNVSLHLYIFRQSDLLSLLYPFRRNPSDLSCVITVFIQKEPFLCYHYTHSEGTLQPFFVFTSCLRCANTSCANTLHNWIIIIVCQYIRHLYSRYVFFVTKYMFLNLCNTFHCFESFCQNITKFRFSSIVI